MTICPTCGNEAGNDSHKCKFCGADLGAVLEKDKKPAILHRRINLEKGRPFVETALKRMEHELTLAKSVNVKVMTLIHGYGSSGKGGKIRVECRKMLDHKVAKGEIRNSISGEQFNRRDGAGKSLIRRYPLLEKYCSSDFNNPGVTIVEM